MIALGGLFKGLSKVWMKGTDIIFKGKTSKIKPELFDDTAFIDEDIKKLNRKNIRS